MTSMMKPDVSSVTTKAWKNTFQRNKLSDWLPYSTYDDVTEVYTGTDNDYGVVYECVPRVLMTSSTSVTIQEMLEKLPKSVHLQIVFFASRNNLNYLNEWELEHNKRADELGEDEVEQAEILRAAIRNMAEMHKRNYKKPISNKMETRLKNNRVFFCLKSSNLQDLKNTKAFLKDILKANNFHPVATTPYELKPILWEVLNGNYPVEDIPEYDPQTYLNRQVMSYDTKVEFHDEHIDLGGRYWKNLSPIQLAKYAHIFDFGSKMGDYLSAVMDSNQFKASHLITINVKRQSKKATDKIEKNHGIIDSQPWGEKFREFWKRKQESGDILDKIKNGEEVYSFDMNVVVSGDTLAELESNAETIRSYWNKGGDKSSIKLAPTDSVHQLALFASLPLGVSDEYYEVTNKFDERFANQLTQFLPLESDFRGTHPNAIMYSRRGVACGLDLFESNINFNGYVIATSGAGKSVLLNNIAFLSYARDNLCFIVDIGGSFKKICDVLGGQYIEPDPAKPISFNPFTEVKSREQLFEDLEYLSSFIYMLGATKSVAKSEEVEKLIKNRVQKLIVELYDDYKDGLEVTYIKDAMEKEEDPRYKDFADQLSSYCRGGLYEGFMCGRSQVDLKHDFVVAELQKVENDEGIRDPLIMVLMYHMSNKLYHGKHGKRMQIIMDECHKFLGKNATMDDFIEQAYRRARKGSGDGSQGSIVIATQGFDDIFNAGEGKLSKAGVTIINNSSWKFFLKQTSTSINMLINSGVFNFTALEEEMIRSVKTQKGEFSETFVISPDEVKIVLRLVMDKFFYYLTTTDGKDKLKISAIQKRDDVNIAKAIETLVREELEEEEAREK